MRKIIDLVMLRHKPMGNGAREAVITWLSGPPACPVPEDYSGKRTFDEVTADALLAYLWHEGFKIVPLDHHDGSDGLSN